METIGKQLHFGYQTHSLIEFLLGDGTRPGWLEKQSRARCLTTSAHTPCSGRLASS